MKKHKSKKSHVRGGQRSATCGTAQDGQLDAFQVSGSSPPNLLPPARPKGEFAPGSPLREYMRLMSREAKRLMAVHGRPGSRIPYSLMYRSWPVPDRDLAIRLPRDFRVPLEFTDETRVAPIFILDRDTLFDVVVSAVQTSTQLALAPLPFESIIVETAPFNMSFADEDGSYLHLDAACITELDRGELWSATCLTYVTQRALSEDPDQHGDHHIIRVQIHADGTFEWGTDDRRQIYPEHAWATMLVEAVQIITARGVTRQLPDRPARREYERATRAKWPQNAWQITIGGGSTAKDGEESGRRLTCRFFVRGHWARLPQGHAPSGLAEWRETASGFEVWRDPFVKGPAGAPWRSPKHPVRLKPGNGHGSASEALAVSWSSTPPIDPAINLHESAGWPPSNSDDGAADPGRSMVVAP